MTKTADIGELVKRLEKLKVWDDHPSNGELGPMAARALTALISERERLALAICGGEDAPGYANAQTVETLEGVCRDQQREHRQALDELATLRDRIEREPVVTDEELRRYIDKCKSMSNDEEYAWWSRLAEILSALASAPERVEMESVKLVYRNWRGEIAERTITPLRIWYGSTEWHPEPQWLLTAVDHGKDAERDFALKDFGASPPAPVVTEALKPFAEFAQNNVEWVGDCWIWKNGSMRERICDWFGPSDFGAAIRNLRSAG